MAYRPNIKNANGTLTDLPIAAETSQTCNGNAASATKLLTSRSIGLSGVVAILQPFNGTSNITIPITSIPATLLTGTGNINITGNAATATTAKDYGSSGTIQTKFNEVDSSLANIGKVKIGTTLYQVRTTTAASDGGQSGFITFIL